MNPQNELVLHHVLTEAAELLCTLNRLARDFEKELERERGTMIERAASDT